MSAVGTRPWLPETPAPLHALPQLANSAAQGEGIPALVGRCSTCGRLKRKISAMPMGRCLDDADCERYRQQSVMPPPVVLVPQVAKPARVEVLRYGHVYYLARVAIKSSRPSTSADMHEAPIALAPSRTIGYELQMVTEEKHGTIFAPAIAERLALMHGGKVRET